MRSPNITWISADDPPDAFPDVDTAFAVPDGLLAAGGDLSSERLLYAYRHGIFPWYDEGEPILWWSPDPRCTLKPAAFHASRRLQRSLRAGSFEVSFNQAFDDVIASCAADRPGQPGTWITSDMSNAYRRLHRQGWAHSVEIRNAGQLVGGLYGIAIGRAFFGESMFSLETNASKAAMFALCRILAALDFAVLDCQVESPHLMSLGAELLPRSAFSALLRTACEPATPLADLPAGRRPAKEFFA